MKKTLLFISSLLIFSSTTAVAAQDQSRIRELEADIEAKRIELQALENNLLEIRSDVPYTIGDSATINSITMALLSVESIDERNPYADIPAEDVLKFNYEVTNRTGQDLTFYSGDFKVFVDGVAMETYAWENTSNTISHNRTAEGTVHFAINGDGKIELVWDLNNPALGKAAVWEIK